MSKILIDNWFMNEVVNEINNDSICTFNYYSDLLMAIVLWDKVYYPCNDYDYWTQIPSEVMNALEPFDDTNKNWNKESIEQLYKFKNISSENYYWQNWNNPILLDPTDCIESSAIRYLMLCKYNEFDYLPHPCRKKFILNYLDEKSTKNFLLRMNIQKNFSDEIKNYYIEAYKSLVDFSDLKIEIPILSKYIFDNSAPMSAVDYAFHLKNEGPVIKYREFLNKIEFAFENQNWKELRELIYYSNDAVNSVLKIDNRGLNNISVKILPIPSIIFGNNDFEMNLSSTPFLTLRHFEKHFKKFNFVFLKDLTKYAINDMKIW